MNSKTRLQLPFDQYSRQVQVLDVINTLRAEGQKFTILDVGGYKGATAALHPSDTVTVLDVFDVDEPNYIKGDALKMSFEDQSFDFVVSFDVFEHIADKDRPQFIAEVARVARVAAIVAAPVKTPENERAEVMMNNLYKTMHGVDHPWLVEHIENGIPARGQAEQEMKHSGLTTLILPSNDTQLWLTMQGAIFAGSKFPEMTAQIDELNATYNKLGPFDGSSDPAQNYRHVVIGARTPATIKQISNAIAVTSFDLAAKITAQEAVNKAYVAALTAMQNKQNELSQTAAGLDHACQVLSAQVHELEREIVDLKGMKSYKIVKKLSKVKRSAIHSSPHDDSLNPEK